MKKLFLSISILAAAVTVQAQTADSSFRTYIQAIPSSNLKSKMVAVPAGTFKMGSADADKQKGADETPQREVSVDAFWMGAYEVTYDEFNAFFLDESISQNTSVDAVTRPSSPYIDMTLGMGKAGGFPANSMQQYGALMYCKWLYKKTGIFFRLPTEAEWEYACRAGSDAATYAGDFDPDDPATQRELQQIAWYNANAGGQTHNVGELRPNPWGLYDMLGNVYEWCLDTWSVRYDQAREVDNKSAIRVIRGGGWGTLAFAAPVQGSEPGPEIWTREGGAGAKRSEPSRSRRRQRSEERRPVR